MYCEPNSSKYDDLNRKVEHNCKFITCVIEKHIPEKSKIVSQLPGDAVAD